MFMHPGPRAFRTAIRPFDSQYDIIIVALATFLFVGSDPWCALHAPAVIHLDRLAERQAEPILQVPFANRIWPGLEVGPRSLARHDAHLMRKLSRHSGLHAVAGCTCETDSLRSRQFESFRNSQACDSVPTAPIAVLRMLLRSLARTGRTHQFGVKLPHERSLPASGRMRCCLSKYIHLNQYLT